jgi:16S rRNA (uracil1498-N3)-methyltransferase
VLRLVVGDEITVFDGSGAEYPGQLAAVEKELCWLLAGAAHYPEVESPLHIAIAQGLTATDKFDLVLQKAVELGVSAVAPISMRRSVVRLDAERAIKRQRHWQGVVVAACEQSGRVRIPEVAAVRSLTAWLAQLPPTGLRLRLSPEAVTTVAALPAPAHGVILVIGPEGGFDPLEITELDAAGFLGVRLGPRILRTETAALAAIAALQSWYGDFRPAPL